VLLKIVTIYVYILNLYSVCPANAMLHYIIGMGDLRQETRRLESQIQYCMSQLTRQVKRRDRLRHRRERQYNLITAILQASSQKRSEYKSYRLFQIIFSHTASVSHMVLELLPHSSMPHRHFLILGLDAVFL
jgi:hypothetical protein